MIRTYMVPSRMLARNLFRSRAMTRCTPQAIHSVYSATQVTTLPISLYRSIHRSSRSGQGATSLYSSTASASSHTQAHSEPDHLYQAIAPNDSFISCTIFDKDGKVVAVSKKFPKTKFLQEHNLFARDLRKIDSSAVDVVPMVAARENYFLVNLLHIKAIVKKDMVMVFDTSNQDAAKKLGLFMYDLESKLTTKIIHGASSAGQPYEFRALESILINVMSSLETDLQVHLSRCGAILSALEDQIDREKLRDLLVYSKSLSNFNQRSQLIRDVLDELLDNDDDLEMMYLTSQINPKAKSSESEVTVTGESKSVTENRELDTADLEMLLEAYYKQGDECVQKAETLINDIKSTEEIVNIILDANRNSLMVYELKITIYTLGFTVATALPAFYGMNLKNYIEESNYGFGGVVACSILCAAAITVLNFSRLRSVQKLTMMVPGTPHKQFKAERDLMTKKAPGQTLPQPRDHHRWRFSLWKRLSRHSLGYMRRMWYMKRRNGYADPKQRDMIWRWLVKEPNDK